jgi:dolichol-phosphate mannosyltransferase
MELSIIIPCYMEEENLRILLPQIIKTVSIETFETEVLVIDSKESLDFTQIVCKENGVKYFNREGSDDFGSAIKMGIQKAKGKYILFMDADGSHSPYSIPSFLKQRRHCDVVIGSRYIDGGATENSAVLVLMSQVLNITYRVFLGLNCLDVSNSFKLYRAYQLKQIKLNCSHFDIVEEILFKLNRRFKVSIIEIPITFKKRMFGNSKRHLLPFILGYIFTMIKLRFGK